ncbi:MAG: hypothetical protein QXU18_07000 [Thermoplasmatales archaeon]
MTDGESEDSDPGGTSVLRVTCLEYVFGPSAIFSVSKGSSTQGTVGGKVAFVGKGSRLYSTVTGPKGVVQ